jgi:ABC-type sugar transport system ATPase subunit
LAFVHQELFLARNLTVAENVLLGVGYPKGRLGLIRWGELYERAAALLSTMEATISPSAKVKDLSPVQQRLVMIAHGLAQSARLIVLDEPTAALTDEEIVRLHDVLRRLAADGVAVVYVSHRLPEILGLTKRVLVMVDGQVVGNHPTASLDETSLVRLITGEAALRVPIRRTRTRDRHEEGETALLSVSGLSSPPRLRNVSFEIRAGEIVGIAGLAGAGRSRIVRLLFGIQRPTAGAIAVRGRPVRIGSPRDALRAGVALIPEDRSRQSNVTAFPIYTNISLPALHKFRAWALAPVPSRAREKTAASTIMRTLSIKAHDASVPVRQLSGGNQQKVALAKWLIHGADIFLFDEPTLGIDVGAKREFFGLARDLAEDGKGILLISSEFADLVEVCDRVLVLREGELVADLSGDLSEGRLLDACYRGARAEPATGDGPRLQGTQLRVVPCDGQSDATTQTVG